MGVPRVPNGRFMAPGHRCGWLRKNNGSYGNFERGLLVLIIRWSYLIGKNLKRAVILFDPSMIIRISRREVFHPGMI